MFPGTAVHMGFVVGIAARGQALVFPRLLLFHHCSNAIFIHLPSTQYSVYLHLNRPCTLYRENSGSILSDSSINFYETTWCPKYCNLQFPWHLTIYSLSELYSFNHEINLTPISYFTPRSNTVLLHYKFFFSYAIQNLKIKIYRTIILPVVLYGCETWSLTLREERRLRVFGIGCWGEYLDLRGTRWQGIGESCITRSWMICTPYPILCGW